MSQKHVNEASTIPDLTDLDDIIYGHQENIGSKVNLRDSTRKLHSLFKTVKIEEEIELGNEIRTRILEKKRKYRHRTCSGEKWRDFFFVWTGRESS